MLINVEQINYKHHALFTQAQDIKELMQPLLPFGVKHFSYQRLDADGGMINLASEPIFEEVYIKQNLYKQSFCAPYDQYTSGYYLGDFIDIDKNFVKALFDHNFGHYLIFVQRNVNNTELFLFGTSTDLVSINNFYLNHLDMFQKFILFFREKAAKLLKDYESERLLYPNGNDFSALTNKKFVEEFITNHKFMDYQKLTQKEWECIKYIRKGYSAKMIAKDLNISHRTVEHHLAHIRKKLSLNSIKQILKYF